MTTKTILSAVVLTAAVAAGAQTAAPLKDADFIGLTTPKVLGQGKLLLGLQYTSFGASDNLARGGISLGYGLGNNLQVKIEGTFSPFDSYLLSSGNVVQYGGSAGDFVIKYGFPGVVDYAIEAGVGYSSTPAQEQVVETVVGGTAGYSITSGVRVYVNPKLITLIDNPIFAVAIGASVDVAPGISLFGDWTPYVSGTNSLSTIDGSTSTDQLYAIGIRFTKLTPGLSLDLAYTNIVGQSYGFSVTPSLGDTGGLYVGLTYGF